MKAVALGIIAAGLTLGVAGAQTSTSPTAPTSPTTSSTTPSTSMNPAHPDTSPDARARAGGNNNEAVATTSANATQPAKGSNSFTEGQAQARIQDSGFTNVTGLKKDDDGVWRGQAQKGGQTTSVWLDYKGNVGQ